MACMKSTGMDEPMKSAEEIMRNFFQITHKNFKIDVDMFFHAARFFYWLYSYQ